MGATGFELPQDSLGKTAIPENRAANSGAVDDIMTMLMELSDAEREELLKSLKGRTKE